MSILVDGKTSPEDTGAGEEGTWAWAAVPADCRVVSLVWAGVVMLAPADDVIFVCFCGGCLTLSACCFQRNPVLSSPGSCPAELVPCPAPLLGSSASHAPPRALLREN